MSNELAEKEIVASPKDTQSSNKMEEFVQGLLPSAKPTESISPASSGFG